MRRLRGIGGIMAVMLPLLWRCSAAEQPWNTRLVGQIGGKCEAVQVVGRYAYIGEGPNLTILDVSNPSSPVLVARLFLGDGFVRDIYVKNGLAYVACAFGGLRIADITNPRLPRLRSSYSTGAWANGVFVTGGLAYIAEGFVSASYWETWDGDLRIVDVTDPSSPTFRGCFPTSRWTFKVFVRNSRAYATSWRGMYILDVTNPSLPRFLTIFPPYYCWDVFFLGNLAYVTDDGTLDIVDVTSPSAPTLLGRIGTRAAPAGIFVSGGLAYVAERGNPPSFPWGFEVFDVSNPSSPTERVSFPMPGLAEDVVVSGSLAYVANWGAGLTILDVTNPSSPTVRGTYDTLSNPTDISVANGIAYVANGVRGFKTLDVSNPQSPRVLGSLPTTGISHNVFACGKLLVSGKTVYYADGDSGLRIIDVTSSSLPRLRSVYNTADSAEDVFVSGGLAYIADLRSGLRIADVTDPTSPTTRGTYDTPGASVGVFGSNGLAYIADAGSGLQIVDVRNPASPVFRSSYNDAFLGATKNVFLSNGIAYITSLWDYATLEAIDVTNPSAPWRRSSYSARAYYYLWTSGGVFVSGGYAYAILDGLRIFDIRNPSSLVLRGFYPLIEPNMDLYTSVFVSGNLVYLTDAWHGLYILQFTAPLAAKRWQFYR